MCGWDSANIISEILALLSCYVRRLVVMYRRFWTTCLLQLQRSSSPTSRYLNLNDGISGLSRNVGKYQSMLLNISEERKRHLQRDGSWNCASVISVHRCLVCFFLFTHGHSCPAANFEWVRFFNHMQFCQQRFMVSSLCLVAIPLYVTFKIMQFHC